MNLGIAGKVALVTAGSKGLGFGSALALRDEGCKVAICARSEGPLADAVAALGGPSDEVFGTAMDITEADAPARMVAETVERLGGLDIVVANAGGPPPARALDVTDEQLFAAVNANLVTSVRLVREARPHMRAAGWGRICMIASYSVKQPIPELALSNAARTGLLAWAKTAADDLVPEGITLNMALPGHHATDRMRAMGANLEGMGDPADFGKVVAFLCSEPARFITGTSVLVDGGYTSSLL